MSISVLSAGVVRIIRHSITDGTRFKRRKQNQRLYDTKIRKETVVTLCYLSVGVNVLSNFNLNFLVQLVWPFFKEIVCVLSRMFMTIDSLLICQDEFIHQHYNTVNGLFGVHPFLLTDLQNFLQSVLMDCTPW